MPRFARLIPVLLLVVMALGACDTLGAEPTPTPEPTATPTPTLTPTPAATTEPLPGHPCFNLSEADCDVIVQASENAAAMTSFQQDFDLSFSASGLDPLTMIVSIPAALRFEASGSGPFTLDVDDMPLNAGLDMNVSGTEEGEQTLNADLPLRITGGQVYLQIPGDGGEPEDVGVPFDAETLGALELPMGLGNLLPVEAITQADPTDFGAFIQQDQLGEILNPSGTSIALYSNYNRLDDTELLGQTMYPFVFTLDVGALLQSPEFSEAVAALSGAAPDDPTMGFAMQLLPTLLRQVESELVITQYVGADDMLIHKLIVEFNLEMNVAALLSSPGGGATATPAEPVALDFMLDVELREINQPQTVTAPEDARLLTAEELQAALDTAAADVEETLQDELGGEVTPEATPETDAE